jgi:hypothetical protein
MAAFNLGAVSEILERGEVFITQRPEEAATSPPIGSLAPAERLLTGRLLGPSWPQGLRVMLVADASQDPMRGLLAHTLVAGHQPYLLGRGQLKPLLGLGLTLPGTAAATPLSELAFKRNLQAFERREDLPRSARSLVCEHAMLVQPLVDHRDPGAPVRGELDLVATGDVTELRALVA